MGPTYTLLLEPAQQPRRRAARQHSPAEIVEASRHYEALMADHFGGEG